ncbi:hypothetical protein Pla111_30210 [Botrimarina hoheduenensis]|uniref:PEP-CTERM protein-sorting domain-containing protein n=2 Tax=Botrimarina hoheduenensis TaxID=2528000 RepID=A0A5C5VSQ9_9BACT|nr:hypothetical protein Pla111_30210 [Botrimarina hoheduenensis]
MPGDRPARDSLIQHGSVSGGKTSELNDVVFLADRGVLLDANTSYWFVLGVADGSLDWSYEDSTIGMGQNTYGPGSIVLFADSTDAGTNWTYYSPLNPYRMQVNVVTTPTLPGDYNGDGTVDLGDYTVWRDGLGLAYTQNDYDVWSANYGAVAAVPATIGSVPEPNAALMLLSVSMALLRRQQHF